MRGRIFEKSDGSSDSEGTLGWWIFLDFLNSATEDEKNIRQASTKVTRWLFIYVNFILNLRNTAQNASRILKKQLVRGLQVFVNE